MFRAICGSFISHIGPSLDQSFEKQAQAVSQGVLRVGKRIILADM
jgi:hypothetical protein